MLVYVDDILCIHEDPNGVLKLLNKYFPLKPDSVGTPAIYLSSKLIIAKAIVCLKFERTR